MGLDQHNRLLVVEKVRTQLVTDEPPAHGHGPCSHPRFASNDPRRHARPTAGDPVNGPAEAAYSGGVRRLLLVVAAALTAATLVSCSQSEISAADAYKVGCPAVDVAVAGGSVANKATVAGLRALRDSNQLNPQAQEWLTAAVQAIETADVDALPAGARQTLVDGCADNGYPLQNLA